MKFTIADFKKVLHGFETETLNIWFARGYIEIENLNPGRGRSRTFTWPEAVKVGVMCHLGVTGRGPKITSEIAKIIGKRAEGTRPEDWIPDILDEDLDQCVFFYQVKICQKQNRHSTQLFKTKRYFA